jgi:hypothetical protein
MSAVRNYEGTVLLAKSRVSRALPLIVLALLAVSVVAFYSSKHKKDSQATPVLLSTTGATDTKSVKIDIDPERVRTAPVPKNREELPVHSILFFGLSVLLVVLWYIFLPVVRVYSNGIQFSYWFRPSQFILFTDLTEVNFFYANSSSVHYAESTRFMLKNGSSKRFLIRYYRNYSKLRAAIFEQLRLNYPSTLVKPEDLVKKKQYMPVEPVSILGKPLLSFRGILVLGVTVGFGGPYLVQGEPMGFLIFLLFGWLLIGASMNSFKVVDDILVVRSIGFFWYSRRIPLSEIVCYARVYPSKAPEAVEIFCKNFRQYHFPAGNFHDKDWEKLASVFREAGIDSR